MTEELDDLGVPIKKGAAVEVDDLGVPLKKKEATKPISQVDMLGSEELLDGQKELESEAHSTSKTGKPKPLYEFPKPTQTQQEPVSAVTYAGGKAIQEKIGQEEGKKAQERKTDPVKNFQYWSEIDKADAQKMGYNSIEELHKVRDSYAAQRFLSGQNKESFYINKKVEDLRRQYFDAVRNKSENAADLKNQLQQAFQERILFNNSKNAEVDNRIKELQEALEFGIETDESEPNHAREYTEEKRKALETELQNLIASKKDFFKPQKEKLEEAYNENKAQIDEIPELAGKTPQEKFKAYYNTLYKEYQDLQGKLGYGTEEGLMPLEGLYRATLGSGDEDYQRYVQLDKFLKDYAPVALLNRAPDIQDEGALSVFGKTAAKTLIPRLESVLSTDQEIASGIDNTLNVLGINKDAIEDVAAKKIGETAKQYEAYSTKDWASMMGTTTGIMLPFMIGSGAANTIMGMSKYGRALGALSETGKIADITGKSNKLFNALQSTKAGRGLVQTMFGGAKTGLQYELTGELFRSQEDEANFMSGFLGGVLSKPVEKGFDAIGAMKIINSLFGNKTKEAASAIAKFGGAIKQGAVVGAKGIGEVAEEFGNELGNIYNESSTFQEMMGKIEERFGTQDDIMRFFIQTFVMGAGMGAGNTIGDIMTSKAKEIYDNDLTAEQRQTADKIATEINSELEEVKSKTQTDEEKRQEEGLLKPEGEGVKEVAPTPVLSDQGIKELNVSLKDNDIKGQFLDKQGSQALQEEIEANYAPEGEIALGNKYDDIRANVFNYDNPVAQKEVNGVDLRIAEGLIRKEDGKNRKSYLLYADGKVVGEFNSTNDAKKAVKYVEDRLINKPKQLTQKTEPDAIQERSTEEILQRQPGEAGERGSERGRMEQVQQGEEVAAESKQPVQEVGKQDIRYESEEKGPIKQTIGKNTYTIENKDGELDIRNEKGEVPSAPTVRKIKSQYAKAYKYDTGSSVSEKVSEGMTEEDVDRLVSEESTNPAEIIDAYSRVEASVPEAGGSVVEDLIEKKLTSVKVQRDQFARQQGDAHITQSLELSYFNKEGTPIDTLAQEISEESDVPVTEQDIFDFMIKYPNGASQYKASKKNPLLKQLNDRFRSITGFDITPEIIRNKEQYTEQEVEFLNKRHDDYEQFKQQYFDAIERGEIEPPTEKTSEPATEDEMAEYGEKGVAGEKQEKIAAEEAVVGEPPSPPVKKEGPKEPSGKKRERAYSQRLRERKKEVSKALKDLYTEKPLFYDQISNEKQLAKAEALLKEKGVDGVAQLVISGDYKASEMTSVNLAGEIAQNIMANEALKAKAEGDILAYNESMDSADILGEAVAKNYTEAGRVISAARVFANVSPAGQVRAQKRATERYNDKKAKGADKDYKKFKKRINSTMQDAAGKIAKKIRASGTASGSALSKSKKKTFDVSEEKLKEIKKKRDSLKERYLQAKKNRPITTGGINPELIEIGAEIAITYIQEGYVRTAALISKLKAFFNDELGENISDDDLNKILETKVDGQTLSEIAYDVEISHQAESLAKKISKGLMLGTQESKDSQSPTVNMLETLYEIAKQKYESGESKVKPKKNAVEFLNQAISQKDKMSEVWNQAQEILLNAYADNTDALQELQDRFGELLDTPFTDKQLSDAIKQKLKEQGIQPISKIAEKSTSEQREKLASLVEEYYKNPDKFSNDLASAIISELEVDADMAEKIATSIQNEIKATVESQVRKELDKAFKESEELSEEEKQARQEKQKEFNKFIKLVSMGAATRGEYAKLFAAKYGLANFNSTVAAQIYTMAQNVSQSSGVVRTAMAQNLANYMSKQFPSSFKDKFWALYYPSQLSGPSTQLINITSSVSTILDDIATDAITNPKEFFNGMVNLLRGLSVGATEAKIIMKEGAPDNRWLDLGRANTKNISPGKHLFGSKGIEEIEFKGRFNPLKLYKAIYKYVPRFMSASDAMGMNAIYMREAGRAVRKYYKEQGLRGRALREKVKEELLGTPKEVSDAKAQAANELANVGVFKVDANGNPIVDKKNSIYIRRTQEIIRNKIGGDIVETSEKLAKIATYKLPPRGTLGLFAKGLTQLVNSKIGSILGLKFLAPYVNVPFNIANQFLDHTPYGILRANNVSLGRVIDASLESAKIEPSAYSFDRESGTLDTGSRLYQKQLQHGIMGSIGAAILTILMNSKDDDDNPIIDISGGQTNLKPEERYNIAESRPPRSFRIMGGPWIPYTGQPYFLVFDIFGSINDRKLAGAPNKEQENLYAASILASGWSFFDSMPFDALFSMVETISKAKEDERYGEKMKKELTKQLVMNATTPFVPNAYKQLRKMADPRIYRAEDIETLLQKSLGMTATDQNSVIDVFGREVKRYPGENFWPISTWINDTDKIANLVFNEKRARISLPSPRTKMIDISNPNKIPMPSDIKELGDDKVALRAVQKEGGRLIYESIKENYNKIKDLPPDLFQKVVSNIVSEQRAYVLSSIQRGEPIPGKPMEINILTEEDMRLIEQMTEQERLSSIYNKIARYSE